MKLPKPYDCSCSLSPPPGELEPGDSGLALPVILAVGFITAVLPPNSDRKVRPPAGAFFAGAARGVEAPPRSGAVLAARSLRKFICGASRPRERPEGTQAGATKEAVVAEEKRKADELLKQQAAACAKIESFWKGIELLKVDIAGLKLSITAAQKIGCTDCVQVGFEYIAKAEAAVKAKDDAEKKIRAILSDPGIAYTKIDLRGLRIAIDDGTVKSVEAALITEAKQVLALAERNQSLKTFVVTRVETTAQTYYVDALNEAEALKMVQAAAEENTDQVTLRDSTKEVEGIYKVEQAETGWEWQAVQTLEGEDATSATTTTTTTTPAGAAAPEVQSDIKPGFDPKKAFDDLFKK